MFYTLHWLDLEVSRRNKIIIYRKLNLTRSLWWTKTLFYSSLTDVFPILTYFCNFHTRFSFWHHQKRSVHRRFFTFFRTGSATEFTLRSIFPRLSSSMREMIFRKIIFSCREATLSWILREFTAFRGQCETETGHWQRLAMTNCLIHNLKASIYHELDKMLRREPLAVAEDSTRTVSDSHPDWTSPNVCAAWWWNCETLSDAWFPRITEMFFPRIWLYWKQIFHQQHCVHFHQIKSF